VATSIGELLIRIGTDVDHLKRGMEDANRVVQGGARKIESAAKLASGALAAIGAGLSVGVLASSFRAAVKEVEAFGDAADQTGASVEELSALFNTLSPYGASLDTITDATGKLARAMAGADEESSKAGAAFAALGIQTRDAQGNLRRTDQVLVELAQALANYEEGTNKVVLAQTLFGKTGAALLPLLKDLAGAEMAQATVTTEAAAEAERLNVALATLARETNTLRQEIASALVPTLASVTEEFNRARAAGVGFFDAIQLATLSASSVPDAIAQQVAEIARLREKIDDPKGLAGVLDVPAAERELARREKVLSRLLSQYKDLGLAQERLEDGAAKRALLSGDGYGPRGQAPALAGGDDAAAARRAAAAQRTAEQATAAAERLREQERAALLALDAKLGKLDDESELQAAIRDIERGRFREFSPAVQAEIKTRAARIDSLKAERAALDDAAKAALARIARYEAAEEAADAEVERARDAARSYVDLVDPAARYVRQLAEIDRLEKRGVAAGGLSKEQALEARFAIQSAIEDLRTVKDAGKDTFAELRSAIEGWGDASADAIADFVTQGKGSFGDLVDSFIADIVRLSVQQAITRPLFDGIAGALGVKGAGEVYKGSGLSQFVDGLSSGKITFGGARAGGGETLPGRTYLVGEKGPEYLTMGGRRGMVTPSGGSINYSPTINVDSRADRAQVVRDIRTENDRTVARIADLQRRGNRALG
jgi:hypothetical protein